MASTGAVVFGTAANDAAFGVRAWNNPTNAQADDTSYATIVGEHFKGDQTELSNYLKFSNANLSAIPDGSTIDGFEIKLWRDNTNNSVKDHTLKLVLGGSVTGDNFADTGTNWPNPGAPAAKTYGGASSLFSTSPTAAQVKDSGFGFVAAVTAYIDSMGRVDFATVEVFYTEGAPSGIDADAGQGLLDLTAVAPTVTKGASLPAVGLDLTAIAATTSKSTTLTAVAVELVGLAGDTPLLAAAGQGLIEVLPVVAATAKQAASGQGLIDVTPLAAATTKAVASGQGSIDFTPVAANATKQAASGQGLVDLTLVAATAAKSAASGQGLVDLTPVAPAAAHAAAVPTDAWLLAPVAPASTKGVASGQGLIDWSPVPAIVTYAAALPADAWLLLPVSPETSKSAVLAAVGVELVGVIAEVELIGIAKFSFQATLVRAPTWASLRRAGT
jgi:hypothetical protein